MSRVFVADEVSLGRKVVVKVLSPELAAGVSAGRFAREIRMAASLQQANIVPVLASGETNGLPYYTMPFVEGESLRVLLGGRGPLSITEVVGILRDVTKALAYAHERGVVHRDIKPDNVLLSGGTAVVTDFGIAKAITDAREPNEGGTFTQVGTSIGTPAYMAPEQAAGDPAVDFRADIYSLGAMAYELLTGRSPFHGRTPQRMLAAHMTEAPQHISEVRFDTPAPLADLVMRCLTKDPAGRPVAAEVVRTLDAVTSSDQSAMPAVLFGGPRMIWKALAIYASAFVVVAIIARAAIIAVGLPDWVFPGALIVMALGLPVILFTAYVHRVTHRAVTVTPTFTPGGTPSAATHGTMATLAMKASPVMSWRRTTLGGVYAVGGFILLVGAWMLLRAMGIGPAGSLLAAGTLNTRDQIIVADFKTAPADSALSGVMAEAMRTHLSQSRVVGVMPGSSVASALQRMQRPADTRVDLAVARDIAAREGTKAILTGEITPLGSGYIVSAKLVSPGGDDLAAFQETIDGPSELITAADRLARKLRGKIGESIKTVRAEAPLMHATTASLEALRKYSEGFRANVTGDYPKAVRLLEEATALDSGFGMAYRVLSQAMSNGAIRANRAPAMLELAYRNRDRMTERERLMTLGTYYTANSQHRDRQKGVEAYERLLQLHPDDGAAAQNVAQYYYQRREYARADSAWAVSIRHLPEQTFAYFNSIFLTIDQGQFEQTRQRIAVARQKMPADERADLFEADLLWNEGKLDSATTLLAKPLSSSRAERVITSHFLLGTIARARGRLRDWRRHSDAARTLNERRNIGLPPAVFDSSTMANVLNWHLGRPEDAVRTLNAGLASPDAQRLPPEQRASLGFANVYAGAGRPDKARAVVAQYDAAVSDTARRRIAEPAYHTSLGWIALAENRPQDALAEFRAGSRLPDGPVSSCRVCEDALIGIAYDRAGMRDSAIATYARFVSLPNGNRWNSDAVYLPFVLRRLGELYEQSGDVPNAVRSYQRFVELWKNADPELQPRVAEIRRRISRLGDAERR